MDTRLPKWANATLLAIVGGIFYLIIQILAAPVAHAEDNIPAQPQFTLPTVAELQSQANAWVGQQQSELTNVVENARKEAETVLAPLMQPAPVIPAAPPVPTQPVLISPEIDQAIVSALPASLPELTQQLVDPVFAAGLSAYTGRPATMPEIERMDKSAPLATQVEAAVDLFAVKDVVPDMNACGGDSIEAKTSCAAAIVADNTPGNQPGAKINLVSRYGVEAWITPWASICVTPEGSVCIAPVSVCGGFFTSMQYCGEIYASKAMFNALAADKNNPTQSEVTWFIAHEEMHNQDALSFPGGPRAFFAHTGANDANTYQFERSADVGAMYTLQSAVNKGQLPASTIDESLALMSRIGFGTDEEPELTHGSGNQRVQAGKEGAAAANEAAKQGHYALVA